MSLQKELATRLGETPKIRWGSQGQFDVNVDGKTVYSAQETGRLPTADEIVALVRPA